jgi:hypothetical protein
VLHSQKRFGTYLTTHGYPSDENATGRGIFRKKIALIGLDEEDSDDEEVPQSANLRQERLGSKNVRNDAPKADCREQNANLANLCSRKSPIENPYKGLSGSKVSKVSNGTSNGTHPIENVRDTFTSLPQAKVSTSVMREACPQCRSANLRWLDTYRHCKACGWKGTASEVRRWEAAV